MTVSCDIKKILVFLTVCLVVCIYIPLYAEEKSIVLGGKTGWPHLAMMENITTGKGRFGYPCLQLTTKSPSLSDSTDLLLHFESDSMPDSSGRYDVVSNSLIRTDKAVRGACSALSMGTGSGMQLHGSPDSIFGKSGSTGSFSIEFWLAPSIAENGETVFSWRSSRNVHGVSEYQTISATFFSNHLEWKFSNVFEGYTASGGEAVLSGRKTVVPDKWSFHKISYNEETGLIEYRVDGITESLIYVTSTGHERGTVYQPILGVPADIKLCSQYTGRMDDFCIRRGAGSAVSPVDTAEGIHNDRFKIEGGRFETEPLLTKPGSVLDSVYAIADIPAQTDIRLYVRSGDNCFGWTETEPAWIPVDNGAKIHGINGLYFQIAAELLPDGGCRTSPSITQLTIRYTEQPLPLPPFIIKAAAGVNSVTLTWSYSVDDTAGGYYIYYGERPGEYLGRAAVEGPSPINAGNTNTFTLTGLKSGTIYYFAISSWSRIDNRINGQLSKEVFARPVGR